MRLYLDFPCRLVYTQSVLDKAAPMAKGTKERHDDSHHHPPGGAQRCECEYRGHKIVVEGTGENLRLTIDGQEIDVRQTESGVTSHAAMYREFSNAFELAESLLRDWGEAQVENPSFRPGHHDH